MKFSSLNIVLFLLVHVTVTKNFIKSDSTEDYWFQYEGHSYKVFRDKKTWLKALKECKKRKSYLVTITSKEENDFIWEKTPSISENYFWIGLVTNNEANRTWWWLETGEDLTFKNWKQEEPNNKNGNENCVEISQGRWNDVPCTVTRRYLCERVTDIDECKEQRIDCGVSRICFNRLGDYQCVSTPCPPGHTLDTYSGECRRSCLLDNRVCESESPDLSISSHQYKFVSLPSGIPANTDIIQLRVYDTWGNMLNHTIYKVIQGSGSVPFSIRPSPSTPGLSLLSTLQHLAPGSLYHLLVQAMGYAGYNQVMMYTTKFDIYVHVSKHPF